MTYVRDLFACALLHTKLHPADSSKISGLCRYVFRDGLTASVRGSPASKIGTLSKETVLLLNSVQASLDDNWSSELHEVGSLMMEADRSEALDARAFINLLV